MAAIGSSFGQQERGAVNIILMFAMKPLVINRGGNFVRRIDQIHENGLEAS